MYRWMLSIFLTTCLASSAVAQGWVISGQVTNSSGAGIPNVAIGMFESSTGNEITALSGDVSGAGGFFSFVVTVAIPVGFYDILFEPPTGSAYFATTRQDVFVAGSTAIGTTVLQGGFFVSGRVVNALGVGIQEVDLNFFEAGTTTLLPTSGDVTDALGFYNVLVPAGTYDVEYRQTPTTIGGPYVPVLLEDRPVVAALALPDVTLRLGYPLTGTVRNTLAQPVIGADIDVVSPLTDEKIHTPGDSTDALGQFSVLVPIGSFEVEIDPPVGTSLVPRLILTTVTAPTTSLGIVVLQNGFTVSGTCVNSALAPVPTVDLDFFVTATQVEIPTAHDNAGPNGVFAVTVEANTYDIVFRPPFATGLNWLRLSNVLVAASQNLGNVVLPLGIPITGTVTASGTPVENVVVTITDTVTGLPVYTFSNRTDFFGDFAIRELAGTYDFLFTPPAATGYPSATRFAVAVAGPTTLDVDLLASPPPPPVTNLSCTESPAFTAALTWQNGAVDYDAIELRRNGSLLATLPGSTVSFNDPALATGSYSYTVSAVRDGLTSAPASCNLIVTGGAAINFRRGDANLDSSVNLADAITILNRLFVVGTPPLPCTDAGDVNDDGVLNIADPITLLSYLFAGGAPPPPPFATAGVDPTSDALTCP
ncbi:MAG: carboxypeptidase regulatory-like domain-containing protein [Planctomycetota bacterium]